MFLEDYVFVFSCFTFQFSTKWHPGTPRGSLRLFQEVSRPQQTIVRNQMDHFGLFNSGSLQMEPNGPLTICTLTWGLRDRNVIHKWWSIA